MITNRYTKKAQFLGKYTSPDYYGYPWAHFFLKKKVSLLLQKANKSMCKLKVSLELMNSGTSAQSPNRMEQGIGGLWIK